MHQQSHKVRQIANKSVYERVIAGLDRHSWDTQLKDLIQERKII